MSEATSFDPTAHKEIARRQWDAAAKGWNDWGPQLRAWLGGATQTMLDMADVKAGSRVLDVAAGAAVRPTKSHGESVSRDTYWRPTFPPASLNLPRRMRTVPDTRMLLSRCATANSWASRKQASMLLSAGSV